jgi:two-component system cell cycle response regulator DivK
MQKQPILVVEDEPDGQELVTRMLAQTSLEIGVADDAEQAWPMLMSNNYVAVVIDLALPGNDGFQLLRAMRNEPALAQVPCVAITAFHTPELKRQALQEGFDAYFQKPLDRNRFVEALETVLMKAIGKGNRPQ